MNVFVVHSVAPRIPLRTVFTGTRPFICADLVRLAVLVTLPALAPRLPNSMGL